ncbi:MAG: hypothetical protein D6741_00315 [Planctomycetota bacterium]|nr:MAG: hypothetical protein D6741_00315 [Planctomycetota bacterium]
MSDDISKIIAGWDFDPDKLSVRIIEGDDGKEKVQLRLDLGLLQMEMDGRPDGATPCGYPSWFDYYQARRDEHEAANPDGPPFVLDDEACSRLWREAVQYYHRYLSLWHLERYEACARDTERNYQLFQFVRTYAVSEENIAQFDQWRPYAAMMHARAVAKPLVEKQRIAQAIEAIEEGIDRIREFLEDYDLLAKEDEYPELVHLKKWRDELLESLDRIDPEEEPVESRLPLLQRRLERAVHEERFEEAAKIRDEIQRLTKVTQ